MNTGGPDISDRDDGDVVGVHRSHEHATLVTGADDSEPHRIAHFAVAEIGRAQTCSGRNDARRDDSLQKISPRHTESIVVILSTYRFFFRSQIHDATYPEF